VVYLISSCVAALSFKMATRKRNVFLIASGSLSGLVGALVYIATKEIFDGFSLDTEVNLGWRSGPVAALASGVMSGFGAFVLQPMAAKLVGTVSRAQLILLRRLPRANQIT